MGSAADGHSLPFWFPLAVLCGKQALLTGGTSADHVPVSKTADAASSL